jgi:hypothetical protein
MNTSFCWGSDTVHPERMFLDGDNELEPSERFGGSKGTRDFVGIPLAGIQRPVEEHRQSAVVGIPLAGIQGRCKDTRKGCPYSVRNCATMITAIT